MIVVKAFIKKSGNRNDYTTLQWLALLHWIKLFIAITVERKTL